MNGASKDASLRHQMAVLRRRWPVILLLAVLACATAAWVTSRRQPVYKATSSILLEPVETVRPGGVVGASVVDPNATATQIEVMLSQVTLDAVREKVGHDPEVEIEARGVTSVIDVHARSTDPRIAANDATSYAEVYIAQRRGERGKALESAALLLQNEQAEVTKELTEIQKPLREADARLNAAGDPKVRAQLQTQRDTLAQSIDPQRLRLERRVGELDEQLGRIEGALRLEPTGGVQLVSKALVPTKPVSASPLRNGALGLAGGLVLGVALAFLLDQLDDRLRRKDELEATVKRPVLGLLPRFTRRSHTDGVLILQSPNSQSAEAYRTLRTGLQFMAIENEKPLTCVQVTSPTSAEGKTTVVTNLAASFAQAGQRVIILDCDLRRPKVHEAFGLPNEKGFTSVLLNQCSLSDAITTLDQEPYLAVLTAGPMPPNPTELLSSDRAKAVLDTLREHCDMLLIDTPPVIPVADAHVVSSYVDATLLVARPQRSTKRQITRADELLNQVKAPLIGTVLNGVVHDSGDGYGYGYTGYEAPVVRQPREKRIGSRAGRGTPVDNGLEPTQDGPVVPSGR